MTGLSLVRMLIEKFYDGVLTEIDLKAILLDLDLLWCEASFDFYPPELRGYVRRRSDIDPQVPLGIAIARSI
jgi:hypothetical protein